jgi:hypothetical protein
LFTEVGVHCREQVIANGTKFVVRPSDAIKKSVQWFKLHIRGRPSDIKVAVSIRRGLQDKIRGRIKIIHITHIFGVRLIDAHGG